MRNGVLEPGVGVVKSAFSLSHDEAASRQGLQRKRVLAVSSGGGHWVQMMRLAPVLEAHNVAYVTVNTTYRCDVNGSKFFTVTDATAWNKAKLFLQAFQILMIVLRQRPDIVISTGAAPGYFAIRFAKWFGARTIWIDSIANVERLSRAGACVEPYADLWLTQWQHLALDPGPSYRGAVL
jgi:UDP-N-acetylglucosamine:LPS N-acetylglucosamine transferase